MNNKILLTAFLVVFFGIGAVLLLSNKKTDNTKESMTPTINEKKMITPKMTLTEGAMELVTDKGSYKMGDKISMSINIDSGDKNIVGYDAVLFYDPLAFEFISASSALSDYKVYSYKKENYLTLTAVKNLSSAASPLKSKAVTLVFDSKKSGKYNFSLKTSAGSEKTDLVTDKTEVFSPELNEITININ